MWFEMIVSSSESSRGVIHHDVCMSVPCLGERGVLEGSDIGQGSLCWQAGW